MDTEHNKLYLGRIRKLREAERKWRIYVLAAGILLPVLFLITIPGRILGDLQIAAYAVGVLQIPDFLFWLAAERRLAASAVYFTGPLLAFGGAWLLFGFKPLSEHPVVLFAAVPAAFACLRTAMRAAKITLDYCSGAYVSLVLLVGALLAAGPPVVAQRVVSGAVSAVIQQPAYPSTVIHARWLGGWLHGHTDRIVRAWVGESDADRRDQLARAYREITGIEIGRRVESLPTGWFR